jgi:hypothetical protein
VTTEWRDAHISHFRYVGNPMQGLAFGVYARSAAARPSAAWPLPRRAVGKVARC